MFVFEFRMAARRLDPIKCVQMVVYFLPIRNGGRTPNTRSAPARPNDVTFSGNCTQLCVAQLLFRLSCPVAMYKYTE